jgi:hypothetical protein
VVTILLADTSPIAASAVARCSVGGGADQAVERVDDIGRHDDGVSEHRLQHREGVKEGRVANAAARELARSPVDAEWRVPQASGLRCAAAGASPKPVGLCTTMST